MTGATGLEPRTSCLKGRRSNQRSAARYAAVRQSVGEPDPFRFKHRAALRQIVGEVVRGRMDRKATEAYVAA